MKDPRYFDTLPGWLKATWPEVAWAVARLDDRWGVEGHLDGRQARRIVSRYGIDTMDQCEDLYAELLFGPREWSV